jgi:DNA-binding CsgD family transcriptional regulator
MVPSASGFVVVDDGLSPLYADKESIQILCYPENPQAIPRLTSFVSEKIRSLVMDVGAGNHFVAPRAFTSGRRQYHCRLFRLNAALRNSNTGSAMALLIERNLPLSYDFARIAGMHRLTQRESETAELLLRGLSSKEIAQRMKVSPNTVKTFLRMIMVKMNVTNRTGIVLKFLNMDTNPPAETV